MPALSDEGRSLVEQLAGRHRLSVGAVSVLAEALAAGRGVQAQFTHPELGGMGQWSGGGMVMVGDMFNHGLKAKVDAVCTALAQQWGQGRLFRQSAELSETADRGSGFDGSRWPAKLGAPSSAGSQNNLHYAVFPGAGRLAVERAGKVTVFDTGSHQIHGVSQQQSTDQSLTFTSQHGPVRLEDLPVVETDDVRAGVSPATSKPAMVAPSEAPASAPPAADHDLFVKLERLADLRDRDIISQDDFDAKKAELLNQL